jgi:hypothetical protein
MSQEEICLAKIKSKGFSELQAKAIHKSNEEALKKKLASVKPNILVQIPLATISADETDNELSSLFSSSAFNSRSTSTYSNSKSYASIEGIRVERQNDKFESFIFNEQIKSHIPYSPTSCVEHTQKSASMELLLSQQRARHGMDMYDIITMQSRSDLDLLMSQGSSYDEAVLIIFDNYTSHFEPPPAKPQQDQENQHKTFGLKSQSMDAYHQSSRPFTVLRTVSESPRRVGRNRSTSNAVETDITTTSPSLWELCEEERDARERSSRPVSLSRRNPFAQGRVVCNPPTPTSGKISSRKSFSSKQ